MQSYIRRCKHCQSEYTYRINGHRWGLQDYVSDYCPECQKAIDEALGKIPVKYEHKWKKIDESRIGEFIEWAKANDHAIIDLPNKEYSTTYIITREGRKYSIYNDDNGEWHLSQMFYYDLINECFTDKEVEYHEPDGVFRAWFTIRKEFVPVVPMNEPIGKLCYMEYKLDGGEKNENRQCKNGVK